jgi:hypothetical protein
MKKKAILGFLVACSLAFNAAVVGIWLAHSLPGHFSPPKRCEASREAGGLCPMQKMLGISDSAWAPIKPQINSYRASAREISGSVAAARGSLLNELEKERPDTAVLRELRCRILSGQEKMQELSMNHILLEKSMLPPAQRHRFFSALRASSACEGGRHGMMGTLKFEDCASLTDSVSCMQDREKTR